MSALPAVLLLFCTRTGGGAEAVWTEVSSPRFIVVSNASAKEAVRAAETFERFRLLIKRSFAGLGVDPGTPLRIFAMKNGKSYKELIGEHPDQKDDKETAGVFMGGAEENVVALRMDLPGDQRYQVAYHEYIHMLMHLNIGRLPLWLDEGLAEFYGNSTVTDAGSTLGDVNRASFQTLDTQPWASLPVLFSVIHDSPYYRERDKAAVFYAESWAITHYLLVGENRKHVGQLQEYLKLLQQGIAQEEAAGRALGDLKALESAVRNYVRSPAFYGYRSDKPIVVENVRYEERVLSEVERLAARGEILVRKGKPELAKGVLERALELDPRNASAHEAMGHLSMKAGDEQQAEKHFSAAADADSRSYLAHFYAAQYSIQNGAQDTGLDVALMERRLQKAIAINPRFAPAYSHLSYVLQRAGRLNEALEAAEKATLLEPVNAPYRCSLATIQAMMGKPAEAERAAREAILLARTDAERNQAEQILMRISQTQAVGSQARAPRLSRPEGRSKEELDAEFARLKARQEATAREEAAAVQEFEKAEQRRKEAAELRQSLKKGPAAKLSGKIASVTCDYPAIMNIVLESKETKRTLFAENYYTVRFWSIGDSGKDGFDPCTELNGKRAEIEYLSVDGQEFLGFIESVSITAPQAVPGARKSK